MVVVVGAGISGLTAAWHHARAGRDVVVLECSERAGGVVRSLRIDGVVVECGPQALQSNAPATLSLVEELGLVDEVVEADAAAKRRFLLSGGRLVPLPGPAGLFTSPLLPRTAPLSLLCEPFRGPGPDDETVDAFVRRRLGDGFAPLVDAFVAGVFGGDSRALELRAAFPRLHAMDRAGGLLRGGLSAPRPERPDWAPRTLFSFRDGLETLTRALADALGDRLRLGVAVERIEGGSVVHAGGERFDAEQVIVAVPPWAASGMLPELAPTLDAMPAAPICAVTLAWPRADVPGPLPGFGWLAPSTERTDVLGALQVSAIFPSHAPDHAVIRVMLGGARDPSVAGLDDDALVERARAVVAEVQGIDREPVVRHVGLHVPGIPQYDVGHTDRVTALQRAIPGVRFLGWGYTGIGVNQGIDAASREP